MKKRILTIGGAMRDIFINYEKMHLLYLHSTPHKKTFVVLEEGRKIEVAGIERYSGGGATNAAVSFQRLGFPTTTFFKIGDDCEGQEIVQELENEGVRAEHIIKTTESETGISFILPCPSNDRTVLVYRGANLTMQESDLPVKAIATCDQLYVTSLSGRASGLIVPITNLAKKYKKMVAVNPGTSQLQSNKHTLQKALPNIDILILNAFEAQECLKSLIQTMPARQEKKSLKKQRSKALPELLRESPTDSTLEKTFCFDLKKYFKEIMQRGPTIAVVTNGAEGVYVATKNTIYFHPSVPVNVVSTIGAGDAFGSCFVAQLLCGKTIQEAMVCGIINAASVLAFIDAKTGLLITKALNIRLKKVGLRLIQTFPLD